MWTIYLNVEVANYTWTEVSISSIARLAFAIKGDINVPADGMLMAIMAEVFSAFIEVLIGRKRGKDTKKG